MISNTKISTLDDYQKHVGLLCDEMYVKEDLVYNKHTGEMTGFCDLGEINNHLLKLERDYTTNRENTNTLATTIMMLMVRWLFTSCTFPYACFPSSNLTGEQLVPIFYEALIAIWSVVVARLLV